MSVCVTGDVHHMSLGTRDQAHLDGTEVRAAVEYARLAAEYDVPVTLFCTGKTAAEEPDGIRTLREMDHVEVAGHNYWAFDTPVHAAWRAVGKATGGAVGSWNGPKPFQRWEIARTVDAFADLGVDVVSWRDHAYRRDAHTPACLADAGIRYLSDEVSERPTLGTESGVTTVPINTPPDHEHVYHAYRTPEFVAALDRSFPFGDDSRDPADWADWVLDRVRSVREDGGVATVLAHPACMQLADGFDAFESMLEVLATEADAVPMRELPAGAAASG